MSDKIVIAMVVVVVVLAHWWIYRWVRCKIAEGERLESLREAEEREQG